MTVTEMLRAAWQLIDQPKKWTKRVYCRDANGFSTGSNPICFCMVGALQRVGDGQTREKDASEFLRHAICDVDPSANHGGPVTTWNDRPERNHADVARVFARAIELAESKA